MSIADGAVTCHLVMRREQQREKIRGGHVVLAMPFIIRNRMYVVFSQGWWRVL